ncbi:hypothetical protein J5Y09_09805 [Roseomonas sp. PWR1]|uniref:YidE/YbjL duplication domain-containing protein n=1 Tax=Roseomonas nitratireducens TaxID=2820810 RepID=A0ABS4AS76_9PROT|nr:hypothetical protein [Neoroseomonas nitratireducens]MBP0464206.1 hypothetical protein [Neoroseomonas nitratireducens]
MRGEQAKQGGVAHIHPPAAIALADIKSMQTFVTTVASQGPLLLIIFALVVLTTAVIILSIGDYLLRLPCDNILGVASGAKGNPAILVFATRMAPTEQPYIGCEMIFPSATIVKLIAVQIIGLITRSG